MTTIILADDHRIVRQGLRALLDAEPDLSVVAEAADGRQAIDLVDRLRPDVLIVDLMMPVLSGLEVARRVSQRSVQTRVVLLSMYASEAYVLEALRSGATGYVLKDSGAEELVQAVREAVAGRYYLSPPLSQRALESYKQKAEATNLDPYETLTFREREVLHLAAEGHTSGEIGVQLSISSRTAEAHRTNAMRKLGLHNQTDLVRYALRRGILPPEH
jgi:DNA-binding NarL/FixJ family response regulator